MSLRKIISGLQTGADQGGLGAALILRLQTGGTAPLGFRTETGPRIDLGRLFGLRESTSSDYASRTRDNILEADGTVVFMMTRSPGSTLTVKMCGQAKSPCLILHHLDDVDHSLFAAWLTTHNVQVLNVAGNRESVSKGIQNRVREFLMEALAQPSDSHKEDTQNASSNI